MSAGPSTVLCSRIPAPRPPATPYTDNRRLIRAPISGTRGLAYVMAPDGQTVAQPPQPAHRCDSTFTLSPAAVIAFVEHTSMHRVQPTLPDRPCAQIRSSYR